VSVESVVLPDGEKYKDMVRLGFSAQLAFSFHFDVL
jgi:hypothetical protein